MSVSSQITGLLETAAPTTANRAASQGEAQASILQAHGRPILLIFLLSLPLFFFYLGGWAFFDPDEGRYAEIPREMIERGDFITPTLNYVNYFEKPPLLYWCVAAAYKVFGFSERAARLVPVLSALAGLFMTYALGRRMFGARTGLLSALVLMTMMMWPIMARLLIIDMLFSVLLFAAMAFWWFGEAENEGGEAKHFLAFWATLALAVLAKGPVAVVLAAGIIFVYLLLTRRWRVLSKMQWSLGLPLFLIISAPWFIMVAQRNPSFNHFFWYGQNFARFMGQGENLEHQESFSFFFKYLPVVMFPWSLFIPGALFATRKLLWPLNTERRRAAIFLICVGSGVTMFFSASTCKLLSYILPVLPPAAILLAGYFDWLGTKGKVALKAPLISGVSLLATILTAVAVALFLVKPEKIGSKIPALSSTALLALSIMLLLWVALLAIMTKRQKLAGLLATITGGSAVLLTCLMPVVANIAPGRTARSLIETIQPGLDAKAEIITYEGYGQSFGYYLRRRLKIIGSPGELRGGMRDLPESEKKLWFAKGIEDVRSDMAGPSPVYCVVRNRDEADRVAAILGRDVAPITGNKEFFIIGNRVALSLTPPDAKVLQRYPSKAFQ